MTEECKAFYAFPSKPLALSETVEEAIKQINREGKGIIHVTSWTKLNNTGKMVISEICKEIIKNDLFMCDVSDLNPNVMFELGFALAKNKRLWLTIDKSIPKHIEYIDNDQILSSIGYQSYLNYEDIVQAFFRDNPYLDVNGTLLEEYRYFLEIKCDTDIFYLKSKLDLTASRWLTQFLKSLNRKIISDDPLENSYQPLKQYLINIKRSYIVIAHLLSNNHSDNLIYNAKYSFLAGIAYGFDKELLMLAPEPFKTPFDYKNMLLKYETAKECVEKTKGWIFPILSRGGKWTTETADKKESRDTELTLLNIRLGEGIAEYEESELDNYFVPTGQYRSGIQTSMGVFVGRKGSGKTANLIKIRDFFLQQPNNLVIVVKPVSFKLESYIKLVETYFRDLDLMGDLTERIWKFLIYTWVAEELYNRITNKPLYQEKTNSEEELIRFVESRLDVVCADFSGKLDYIYQNASKLFNEGKNPKSVLELIFTDYLSKLTSMLKQVLKPYQRIVLLFDNLDKAWEFGRDINVQSNIILGLLGFQNTFKRDMQWEKGDARILIFLREDIYNYAKKKARESDKVFLGTHNIEWDDKKLLLRIIEERFKVYDDTLKNNHQVWEKYFCKNIDGLPTDEYIVTHIIPRPRDLIYVISSSIDECINHGNTIIEEQDIKKALGTYFKYLIENIITEYSVSCPNIRDMIYSFLGTKDELTWGEINRILRKFISKEKNIINCLEDLLRVSFIGIIINGEKKFAYNEPDIDLLLSRIKDDSKKVFYQRSKIVIHPAFISGLRIQTDKKLSLTQQTLNNLLNSKKQESL